MEKIREHPSENLYYRISTLNEISNRFFTTFLKDFLKIWAFSPNLETIFLLFFEKMYLHNRPLEPWNTKFSYCFENVSCKSEGFAL